MRIRFYVISALPVLLVTPAIAATYYISQDVKTKVCTVVTEPPDGTTHVQIGFSSFSTEESATIAMKATPECAVGNK